MVTQWLPVDLLNISTNIDCLKMWLASIKRSFWGLFVAFKTMRIIEELMKIWPNKVCNSDVKCYNIGMALLELPCANKMSKVYSYISSGSLSDAS